MNKMYRIPRIGGVSYGRSSGLTQIGASTTLAVLLGIGSMGCGCVGDSDGDGVPDCYDNEECDGVDNNGDGQVDEGFDADGDGVPDCEPAEQVYTYYGGKCGNLGAQPPVSEPATPSAALAAYQATYWPTTLQFNEVPQENGVPSDRGFGHTFSGLPACVIGAKLEIAMKPSSGSSGGLAYNDSLSLDFNGVGASWGRYIKDLPEAAGSWPQGGSTVTFNLDLAALPSSSGTVDILSGLGDGALDIMVQDDTGVDCAILTVTSRCDLEQACDGRDNDGDGQVDEGWPDSDGDGIADCVDQSEGEKCDGKDNDGDGMVDEGYPDSDGDGIADCVDKDPEREPCDGKDNNGDGQIDEGHTDTDGDGIADCVDEEPLEKCNGVDDDVDGEIDEGYPDTDGDGMADCVDEDPKREPCDGRDNNGDGQVDEGHTDTDGDGMADCVDEDPKREPCDGKDNNGDGQVDEGHTDTDGDGMADCVDPDPKLEPCDGRDNNGDGQVDEGHPDSDKDGIADCVDVKYEVYAGSCDQMRPDLEKAVPSDDLLDFVAEHWVQSPLHFDQVPGENGVPANTPFVHTITGLQPGICAAKLQIAARPSTGSGGSLAYNDSLALEYLDPTFAWGAYFTSLPESGGSWVSGMSTTTFSLDLSALPSSGGPVNLLSALADGDLDIYVQDDSGVDCIRMVYTTRCDIVAEEQADTTRN